VVKKAAQAMKDSSWHYWTRVDYSVEYFQHVYLFAGIFLTAVGVVTLTAGLLGGPNHARGTIGDYVVQVLVGGIFVFVLFCILYLNTKFRI